MFALPLELLDYVIGATDQIIRHVSDLFLRYTRPSILLDHRLGDPIWLCSHLHPLNEDIEFQLLKALLCRLLNPSYTAG
jgi:hypothetical protein